MSASPFQGVHVHLLGIAGSGVSALVPLLLARGATVSGCDVQLDQAAVRLRDRGIRVDLGHDPAHLSGVALVVHSAAIPIDHPELAAARAAGIPVLTRGQCLVRLMDGLPVIAVSGSHGKTSTTWMCGHLLTRSGADPVVMVGGTVASLGGGARVGRGAMFVAEVDESDGSFAQVAPHVAVVTNLDHEHLRHYGSFDKLEDAFAAWVRRVPVNGTVIVPAVGLNPRVLDGVVARVVTVGIENGDGVDCCAGALQLGPESSRCQVLLHGRNLGTIDVPIPGVHMVQNALMALVAARAVSTAVEPTMLADCERVGRRFRVHGTEQGVRVVEDYGHHPVEVRATIAAARLSGGRVQVLFQPHRYTRTADCFADFIAAFDQAHRVAVLPIYAASEAPIAGITSSALVTAIRRRRGEDDSVSEVTDAATAAEFFLTDVAAGDTVLVLGAGDVGAMAPPLLECIIDFFAGGGYDLPAIRKEIDSVVA